MQIEQKTTFVLLHEQKACDSRTLIFSWYVHPRDSDFKIQNHFKDKILAMKFPKTWLSEHQMKTSIISSFFS